VLHLKLAGRVWHGSSNRVDINESGLRRVSPAGSQVRRCGTGVVPSTGAVIRMTGEGYSLVLYIGAAVGFLKGLFEAIGGKRK
jgi:hypothetical protein